MVPWDNAMRVLNPISRLRRYRDRKSEYHINRSYVLGWLVVALHHIIVILSGLSGFLIAPAPSIASVVGWNIAVWLWSGTFVLFGLLAFFARIFRRARAEVVAVLTIAGARVLWSGIIIYSVVMHLTPKGSLQIALVTLSGAVFLLGWLLSLIAWLSGVPLGTPSGEATVLIELRNHLKSAIDGDKEDEEGAK